mmetsp:Transcript_2711/g.3733  ORF Transcript_2711/g.3733 Transcript_2711/m.3733 type:complete len:277 (-) Transcript_2711:116-946(-)
MSTLGFAPPGVPSSSASSSATSNTNRALSRRFQLVPAAILCAAVSGDAPAMRVLLYRAVAFNKRLWIYTLRLLYVLGAAAVSDQQQPSSSPPPSPLKSSKLASEYKKALHPAAPPLTTVSTKRASASTSALSLQPSCPAESPTTLAGALMELARLQGASVAVKILRDALGSSPEIDQVLASGIMGIGTQNEGTLWQATQGHKSAQMYGRMLEIEVLRRMQGEIARIISDQVEKQDQGRYRDIFENMRRLNDDERSGIISSSFSSWKFPFFRDQKRN